ncbi:protein phosphatase 2C domain-containing protein [Streptomyces umbrinus]|uniref:protein phosphatase 2C domain-containing protein n=1 Tax=Streptomyces umbrinus TaxID=67370 RepID=UPI0033E6CB47
MSQQGEKPTGQEDDWWGQLYDDSTGDTGPAAAADSLDDRFASASDTVGAPDAAPPPTPVTGPGIPPPRTRTPAERRRHLGSGSEPADPANDTPADEVPRPDGPAVTGFGTGWPVAGWGPSERQPPEATGGPLPGGPENDPLRRSGLQRQRAPWEAPPPVFKPVAPHAPEPEPESSPPAYKPAAPRAPEPEPESSLPAFQQAAPRAPEPDAAVPRSGTSPQAPGAGTPTSRTPSDASPPPSDASPPPATASPYAPPATLIDAPSGQAPAQTPVQASVQAPDLPTPVDYVGSGPPTYDAEPTALPPADVDELDDLVADTVLDGAAYGTSTLRAVSVRGDSARYRGEPRRDSLLTARFGVGDGALVLVAMATGARATPGAHRAAAEACQWIGRAVGRSHARLAEDIRAARRGDLKSGLHRLTDRSLGKLRASAAEQGIEPEEYTASLRCLLLPADPECRTRVFFGVGAGGLFRLRDGEWQDIEPHVADTAGEAVVGFGSLPHETPDGDRLTMDLGITTPPSPYEPAPEPPPRDPFRFRASVARPGDTLLLCTSGLAEPLRGEPALAEHLTSRWSDGDPPGLAAFLADTLVRVKGYADDRTAAAVWEA